MPKLFSLFDDSLRRPHSLVSGGSQSIETIGETPEDQEYILRKIQQFEVTKPKVDFSDFSNFVFFNSALDYFNITGELILNQYPFDGSRDVVEDFLAGVDDYQRYVIEEEWPRSIGSLRFDPSVSSAYVAVPDVGVDSGVTRTSLMSPGTGSFSVEFWCVPPAVTGSNSAMVVLQKTSGSDGYTVYCTGSQMVFHIISGSTSVSLSAVSNPGTNTYYSFVVDRSYSIPLFSIFTGSATSFPVIVASSSIDLGKPFFLGDSYLYMGSGSVSGKQTLPFTGSLDDVRLWNSARSAGELSGSFNARVYAQKNLLALWRFSEPNATGSGQFSVPESQNSIVWDSSGRKLHGKVINYRTAIRQSGSLLPFDSSDPIVTYDSSQVRQYVDEKQTSGSIYDRSNDNLITRLVPSQFIQLEEIKQTDVLQNFLYVLGRSFDQIKTRIDQFVHLLRVDYGQFDQAPDALLEDVGKFFGWEFTGNFLSSDMSQYIFGRNVLPGLSSNQEMETKLFQIKNEFWKRTLANLMYIYKTKGTRESIQSLLRVYGANQNFVRLKEYGVKPETGLRTFRVESEKSIPTLMLGSGSFTGSNVSSDSSFYSSALSIESRVRFPTSVSSVMPASLATGSVWTISSGSQPLYQLTFKKSSISSLTGSLVLSSSVGTVELSGANIFDSRWYNVLVTRDGVSSSLGIVVRGIDGGEIEKELSAYSTFPSISTGSVPVSVKLGSMGAFGTQLWMQEFRVWDRVLTAVESRDHSLNFQSYGTERPASVSDLVLHWRLDEELTGSSGGEFISVVRDYVPHVPRITGTGRGFVPSSDAHRRFLNEFNYVASPENGWNEEKVRTYDGAQVPMGDLTVDSPFVALEFNMVDALNEDISQIVATLDVFNEFIGSPANRYREEYPDLSVLRESYFKRIARDLNFRIFFDMLEFFDRSFVEMVKRLIPSRAVFLGEQLVVESHMLERPKHRWNYRRQERPFQPEGVIRVYIRT